jgi:hypothetical protein
VSLFPQKPIISPQKLIIVLSKSSSTLLKKWIGAPEKAIQLPQVAYQGRRNGTGLRGSHKQQFHQGTGVQYADFVEHGSEANGKADGKFRIEGKNYVVNDSDIILFFHGAGTGSTKKK